MARGSAGSRCRFGGTGPGLGRLPSAHSRGPVGPPSRPLGGRAHAQPSATTTTPGKGALTKGREAAGRPAGGGAGSPGAGRPQRFVGASRSRPAKGAGRRDPSSLLRQAAAPTHSLCHPPSLYPSPEATEPGRCPGSPPLPRHHSPPPDSHPSLRSREISRLTGPTSRETRLRTRARPHGSARIPSLGGVSRVAHAPTSVQPGFAQLAELLCHAGVRCIHFTLKSEKKELICSLSFFPLPKIRPRLTLRLRSLP
ncbi:translation initiation factor IF-2-like [Pteropus medius]|uniref:translation initiation factor IF-2-like n=1 Tax=Pteropus vampyrus TaxID=132908 RepID=UPI00196A5169|nr:translation initiation factor IF-2-like [Pteropus giganteus]